MGIHMNWIEEFESNVNLALLAEFTSRLSSLYGSTHSQVEDLPIEYQRYLRPHLLRTHAELALLAESKRHGVNASIALNSSKDGHVLVTDGPYVITLSRSQTPSTPPRLAKFRATYADYCALGQFYLPGAGFSEDREVLAVSDQAHPMYVLITHGPRQGNWREVGFVYANRVMPSGNGFRFVGSGIDLLDRFGSADQTSVEIVPEPEVEIRENGVSLEHTGGDA